MCPPPTGFCAGKGDGQYCKGGNVAICDNQELVLVDDCLWGCTEATPGKAKARRPDMGQMQSLVKKIWGELPDTTREQMLEPLVEEFLPKYELLIEEYFRRLAAEQEDPG